MYLKKVTMHGFKSFADKVAFDFSSGVTCIVGPNGCGKSNVVDAYKWVLGEQSAKLLRGRQMADMIFNGSSTRKSSGMAEVELVFDNADHQLPIEPDEVRITRRLYRSGESEYLVNGAGSRLKDIRELFLDTGVGADTYSLIEQGRVDILLTSSPADRRAIFEEAAGIGKYKVRKREAQRKLDRTHQNLLRVDDIVEEVQKRLRSVKLQAGKARNFQAYDARLKELRAGYSLAEFHKLSETIDRLARESTDAEDVCTELRSSIDRNEARAASIVEQIDRVGEELSTVDQSLIETKSEIATHDERVASTGRRIEELKTAAERSGSRIAQLRSQREQTQAQLDSVHEDANALQGETHGYEERLRALTGEERDVARDLTEARANVEDEKAGLIELMRRTSKLRNEIESLHKHRETLEAEQGRLGEREKAILQQVEGYVVKRNTLQQRVSELNSLTDQQSAGLTQKTTEAEQARERSARLSGELGESREVRSGLRTRKQLLDELDRKMEGVGAGVRTILDLKTSRPDDPALAGVHGMVGELFVSDIQHASVIEAALGDFDQQLVMAGVETLRACREHVGELPGRVSAICLDRVPPIINDHDLSGESGFVALASEWVSYDERFERLAKHLLGRTVVVERLDHALGMAAKELSGRRFVTLAGEVVEPTGVVSCGPMSSRAGLITRKSERLDVAHQLDRTESRIEELQRELNDADASARHLTNLCEELQQSLHETNTARAEANVLLDEVKSAIDRLTEEQPMIAGEVALIQQQISEAADKASVEAESVDRLESENAEREQNVTRFDEAIDTLSSRREQLRRGITETQVALGALAEKRSALANSIHQLRRSLTSSDEAITHAEQERESADANIAESQQVIAVARERLALLVAESERLDRQVIELRHRREMLRNEAEQLAARTREIRSRLGEFENRLHELDIEKHESAVRREELASRTREELNIDLSEKYTEYDHTDQDWQAVENEIDELKKKIDRLGNVNLDAINELDELEERETFLTGQRNDLNDSRKQLEELITRLDAECIQRFTSAFETIRTNFHELFRKLFGGGKADIVLEDPEDILECGIEILAKPPGKELQRISLMSGGEKTMTAIALLMSIFRSRPSPLAILDEVDAALDEANNERFNNIVREFLDKSQFIIVTHSKRTMAIADQLYGVTMQEPGVSTPVSVKFETVDSAVA